MKKLLFMLTVLLIIQPIQTFALSCEGQKPAEEAFQQAEGVALGYVDEVFEKNNRTQILRVKVLESYKGIQQNWIYVEEDISWGERSERNQEYLFYLDQIGDDWVNRLCSQTRESHKGPKHLDYLKQKKLIKLEHIEKPGDPTLNWIKIGGVSALIIVIGSLIIKARNYYK